MGKIISIKNVEEVLMSYVPKVSKYSGDGMSLERLWPLLEATGNPHKKLKVIHVAGTSGKTSTAYYLSALLGSTRSKVGLTVSPHVDSIKERLQINNKFLSNKQFCGDFTVFMNLINKVDTNPSYFELLIVFAYWEFVRQNVDYAVIETGLGGLLDGTNVATRKDKVCVITDIGLDHTKILGRSISDITIQKAGIIQTGNVVFMYRQSKQVMNQVKNRVLQKKAVLNTLNQNMPVASYSPEYKNLPAFQKRNWLLAKNVFEYLAERDGLSQTSSAESLNIVIPGRMEVINLLNNGQLIMDGAHNSQKIKAFVESFKKLYPHKKAVVVVALKEGKEFTEVLSELSDITEGFIFTTFNTSQDLPAVSQDVNILNSFAVKLGIDSVVEPDNRLALSKLLKNQADIKLIIGSFYLLGQIRKLVF